LMEVRGQAAGLRMDNGPEFTSNAVDGRVTQLPWYEKRGNVTMYPDYLNSLLFTLKNQTLRDSFTGIEPRPSLDGVTPENLQKALNDYVKTCARKAGIENTLPVRQGIQHSLLTQQLLCPLHFYPPARR
jgi:hypothetical protein